MVTKYNLHDVCYILGGAEKAMISEISIQSTKIEYKLWKVGTVDYAWFEEWQITTDPPIKIGFKTT